MDIHHQLTVRTEVAQEAMAMTVITRITVMDRAAMVMMILAASGALDHLALADIMEGVLIPDIQVVLLI